MGNDIAVKGKISHLMAKGGHCFYWILYFRFNGNATLADLPMLDRIMTEAGGFAMGPFSLMDLTGLDVTYPASRAIWEGNGFDSRLCPPALMEERLKSGLLGRKSGRGFRTHDPVRVVAPQGPPAPPVWCATDALANVARGVGLTPAADRRDAQVLLLPADGRSTLAQATAEGIDPARAVGCDLAGRMPVFLPSPAVPAGVSGWFCATGLLLQDDAAGSVLQRIALQLALIAGDMINEGVADESTLDYAATSALGHSEGPIARLRRLGPARMERLRAAIHGETGSDRFRPSPWLTRAACLGRCR